MRLLCKSNFDKHVALNLIQGRTGVRFCDAESSSARRISSLILKQVGFADPIIKEGYLC